ncbi:hypothetical protein C4K04_3851 [Pseudomonas chlororaphis]|uniref:Uncharacterized protein n=1 Tax=Pseudomonas chlororaphis TaxID=587753 RepID=A0A3G7TR17_9PSED|nr:hypothetical protein C4K04_3851 [Pseudomonas chlororaphis]
MLAMTPFHHKKSQSRDKTLFPLSRIIKISLFIKYLNIWHKTRYSPSHTRNTLQK